MTHGWIERTCEGVRVYEGRRWRLVVGRWQDADAAGLLDGVGCVISDPPYDEQTHAGGRRGVSIAEGGNGKDRGRGVISDARPVPFDPVDPARIVPGLLAIARRWVLCCCAIEQLGEYRSAALAVDARAWKRGGILLRTNPTPQFTGDRPGVPCDGLAIMHAPGWSGHSVWHGGGKAGVWSLGRERGPDAKAHPTQKPVALMRELIADFCDEGELICDPYAGSGTTGVAALALGMRFVGCEISDEYALTAARRLAAAEAGCASVDEHEAGQSSLF